MTPGIEACRRGNPGGNVAGRGVWDSGNGCGRGGLTTPVFNIDRCLRRPLPLPTDAVASTGCGVGRDDGRGTGQARSPRRCSPHVCPLDSLSALDVHTQVASANSLRTALERLAYSRDALAPRVEVRMETVGTTSAVARVRDAPALDTTTDAGRDKPVPYCSPRTDVTDTVAGPLGE